MPLIIKPKFSACFAERLARARTGPNSSIVIPSGGTKGVGPDADSGKEVALRVAFEVIRRYIPN